MSEKYPKMGSILKKLLFEKDIKASDLASAIGVSQPTIHRILTGKSTRPYQKSLALIAKYFSITINQLVGKDPLSLVENNQQITPSSISLIPILSWNNINVDTSIQSEKQIPFIGQIGKNAFATILEDISMEPVFSKHSILIFDPDKPLQDGGYILIQSKKDNRLFFRQLLIDMNKKYIKALNPDLVNKNIQLLNKKDTILGSLVESRQNFEKM